MHQPMSALAPKADMWDATRDVRFVPIADIAQIPACLIADVNMPAMTGIELYRCLHAALTARRAT
jgi:FixJ family two-component response regulator